MEQTPSAAQATNFATKTERQRQINPLKEAKLTKSLKQAESFADKKSVIAPDENCADREKHQTIGPPRKTSPKDDPTSESIFTQSDRSEAPT